MSINIQTTVGELVVERPARARMLESLGIDYCCGGRKPLAEACAAKNLDAATVARVLDAADAQTAAPADREADFANMSLSDLADHIETTHHAYLKKELPRLQQLIHRVTTAHGDRHPHLHNLLNTYLSFQEEMLQHMAKEEQVLFPMVRQLETSDTPPSFHCGSLGNPISMMEHEHDQAGDVMTHMRTLTSDYEPPADACNTYRVMLDALRHLEEDTHRHVHKENSILFPRALAQEKQAVPAK